MTSSPVWKEPPMADSHAMVTGYPIESPPPTKLIPKQWKKKQITPIQQGMPVQPSPLQNPPLLSSVDSGSEEIRSTSLDFMEGEDSSDGDVLSYKFSDSNRASDTEPTMTPPPERKLKDSLKTNIYNEMVKPSEMRRRSARNSGNHTNVYEQAKIRLGLVSIKKEPMEEDEHKQQEEHRPPLKRIKISIPKKYTETAEYVPSRQETFAKQARQSSTNGGTDDKTIENQDFCSVCGGAGKFLCCDTCPRSFHFTCVDPPLDEDSLPEGEWSCRECYTKRHPPTPYKKGYLFTKLLNQLQRRNPKQFQLPKKLKERYENVGTNKDGEYQEEYRNTGGKKVAHNRQEDDPLKLFDKNGNPALCFKCSKSALNGTQMVNCDFCNSFWHVDCLDPPLYAVGPTWKCPNHADQAAKLPRRPRKSTTMDVSLRRGFKNSGNIDIMSSDEEDEEVGERLPFFDICDRDGQIYASVPKSVSKTFVADDIVYKLPAEGIKLDFIDAVKASNNDMTERTRTSEILVSLDELALRVPDDRQMARNLSYLQQENSRHTYAASTQENLLTLLDAALETDLFQQIATPGASPSADGVQTKDDEEYFNDEKPVEISGAEREQLLAIKRLMQMKGKNQLMNFLLSD